MVISYLSILSIDVVLAESLNQSIAMEAAILSTTNSTSLDWLCWTENMPRLTPANYEDCRSVAEGIQTLPPSGRPLVFGTERIYGIDYLLPMSVSTRTCKVRLLPLSTGPHINDSFTPRYLSHAVNRMSQQCVFPAPHLGGEGDIGKKKIIGLVVAGFLKPKESSASNRLVIKQGISLDTHED